MGPDQAVFRRYERDGVRTLSVFGEIDLATATQFEAELDAAIAEAQSPAAVDLSGVSFIDSTGLHALIRARKHAAGAEVRLVLVNPSKECRQILEVTDTAQLFEIVCRNDDDREN